MSSAAFSYYRPSRMEELAAIATGERARRIAAVAGLLGLGAFWGVAVGLGGTSAVILCLVVVAAIFCLRDFRAGVAILILIMPVSQSYVFPHAMFGLTGLNPLNLLVAVTLASLALSSAGEGKVRGFLPPALTWLYIAPLAVGALLGMNHAAEIPAAFRDLDMVFFNDPPGYLRDEFAKPLMFVLYALLVASAVARSGKPERFIVPMLGSVFVMAAVVIVFTIAADVKLADLAGTYARAFFSPLGMHANDLGRLYACAYALMLFTWDRSPKFALKAALAVAMALVVVALLLTFSRGAFFGFILVNVVYLFSRRRVKTLVLATLLIPVALFFMPGAVWSRMTMGFGEGLNTISAGRVDEIWTPLLPTFAESPIWGSGLGSIMWSEPMVHGRLMLVAHPHNGFLQAFMDIGVLGLVALLAYWIHAWRGMRKLRNDERLTPELQGFFEGAAAGLLAFVVAAFTGSSLMPVPEQAFLWLAVGMMYGVQRRFAATAAHK